jgi:hypothetical protein
MAQGSYRIWPAGDKGELVGDPIGNDPPNIAAEESTDIYFGLPTTVPQPPPKDQLDLQQEIEKVLRTVQLLYRTAVPSEAQRFKSKFRAYYVRLFRLAQIGLEGDSASPEIAKVALAAISGNLVDDEAARIKNGHLRELGKTAIFGSLPFLALYSLVQFTPPHSIVSELLLVLRIEPPVFANFMLMWTGCFTGVWLSYGIRTTGFTLSDLTKSDGDYLLPVVRLLFAGVLTMILGLMFALGAVEIKVGAFAVTNITGNAALAFLVGTFCGTSELLLPSIVAKRSSEFLSTLK